MDRAEELQIASDDMKLALRYAKDIQEFVLSAIEKRNHDTRRSGETGGR